MRIIVLTLLAAILAGCTGSTDIEEYTLHPQDMPPGYMLASLEFAQGRSMAQHPELQSNPGTGGLIDDYGEVIHDADLWTAVYWHLDDEGNEYGHATSETLRFARGADADKLAASLKKNICPFGDYIYQDGKVVTRIDWGITSENRDLIPDAMALYEARTGQVNMCAGPQPEPDAQTIEPQ